MVLNERDLMLRAKYRAPFDPKRLLAKRVLALEGDLIKLSAKDKFKWYQIPKGHVWVEGDAGIRSRDSLSFGPVIITTFLADLHQYRFHWDYWMVE